jgi:hypothetical protein
MLLMAITPGCATKQVIRQKTNHYKATIEAQGKELQITAFDSAGCPALCTRLPGAVDQGSNDRTRQQRRPGVTTLLESTHSQSGATSTS